MTPQEQRGRIYLLALFGALLVLDVGSKALLLIDGKLRLSQVVGTFVTGAVCWALWRGSVAAYSFFLVCVMAAIVYLALVPSNLPRFAFYLLLAFAALFLLQLSAPATRAFLKYQRERRA